MRHREGWPDAEQLRLISSYLDWTAPSLLTLQALNRTERARLEKCLSLQAESVEHHWRLYPDIIDEKCVWAARVQNRLQKAHEHARLSP